MKTKIPFLPLIAIVLMAVSCQKKKEYVISKTTIDITVDSADWTPAGTIDSNNYQLQYVMNVPEITQHIMDNGMVLCYLSSEDLSYPEPIGYTLMPYMSTTFGNMSIYSAVVKLDTVTFTVKDTELTLPAAHNAHYRLIVCDEVEKNLLINTDLNNYKQVLYTLENTEK